MDHVKFLPQHQAAVSVLSAQKMEFHLHQAPSVFVLSH